VVTSPSRDGQAARAKASSGTFSFQRPNRFKFVYKKPFAQSIVADGQTLWLYDVDLNQVTARKQAQALSATPAALIASATDLKSLQADFVLANAPDQEGLEWAVATPKAKDSSLQQVRMGFKGHALAVLEILDSFGQKSVMRYSAFDTNGPVEPGAFQFKPPAGADVIAQ
jgi:outer membrane lipoprotein carrier protein